jgi:hypothetical protein
MRLPEFSAEASLGALRQHYRRGGSFNTGGTVSAQLMVSPFHPVGGGIFGGTFGFSSYYECLNGCEAAHSMCLDDCEGTIDNPKPSRNCLICDDNYNACKASCGRDIA